MRKLLCKLGIHKPEWETTVYPAGTVKRYVCQVCGKGVGIKGFERSK